MGGRIFLAVQAASLGASLLFVTATAYATVDGDARLAFLSDSDKGQPIPAPAPMPDPQGNANPFDGRWTFTGAGCRGAGSVTAAIKNGKVIVRGGGGNVTPDGIIHTVGAGNGMTLTAEGRLSGDSGSGTYDRSDGCSGTWIAIKLRR